MVKPNSRNFLLGCDVGITQDFAAKIRKSLDEWREGRAASVVIEDIDEAFKIYISKVPYKSRKPKGVKKRPQG